MMTVRWANEGNWHPWCEWCDTNHPEGEHGSKDSARFEPGPLRIGRDFAGNEDGAEAACWPMPSSWLTLDWWTEMCSDAYIGPPLDTAAGQDARPGARRCTRGQGPRER
jgi:hypothetical protein